MAIVSELPNNQTDGNQKANFDKHASSSFADWWQSSGFSDIDNLIFFPQAEIGSTEKPHGKDSESIVFPGHESMGLSQASLDQTSMVSCLTLGRVERRQVVGGRRYSMTTESQDDSFMKIISASRSAEDQKMHASLTRSCPWDSADSYNAHAISSVLVFGSYEPFPIAFVPSEDTPDAQEDEAIQQNIGSSWKSTIQSLKCLFCSCC